MLVQYKGMAYVYKNIPMLFDGKIPMLLDGKNLLLSN